MTGSRLVVQPPGVCHVRAATFKRLGRALCLMAVAVARSRGFGWTWGWSSWRGSGQGGPEQGGRRVARGRGARTRRALGLACVHGLAGSTGPVGWVRLDRID
ncbi:hypothetical protein F511_18834 [Dorcoceras hygrometricum]|uniref:Uncharacterized protein n=1 Tax=Dorcoceras hygrometricum TaxID=472368 RepID=A0A2Z7DEL6_9LAMI|nr:hypothetical protein F511_18834 [Dorcoceras hygrometricum]